MSTITEGRLTFSFPDNWIALKYDAEDGFYKRTLDKHFRDIKAVDIVGANPTTGQLVLLEIKDFRGHEVANRKRISSGELAEEVGQKVLHTLSGLYLGLRQQRLELKPLQAYVLPPPDKLEVVLFLEEDSGGSSTIKEQNRNTNQQNLITKLKTIFKPLGIKTHLYSQATIPTRIEWTVTETR